MANVEVKIVTRVNGKKVARDIIAGEVTGTTSGAQLLDQVVGAVNSATGAVRQKLGV